jgi:hypothetical protein
MIDRIYHSYLLWEDYKLGMYEKTCYMDEQRIVQECIQLLSCPEWLYETMSFVTHNWFYSTEHNLSNTNRNRQAWLGQAACNMAHGAPEYITKQAWHFLSLKQQDAANKVADEVIEVWEDKHSRGYFAWAKLNSENQCLMQQENESPIPSIILKESTSPSVPEKTVQ